MIIILTLIIFGGLDYKYSPRLDYIKESGILILYYSIKNIRKSFVLWK